MIANREILKASNNSLQRTNPRALASLEHRGWPLSQRGKPYARRNATSVWSKACAWYWTNNGGEISCYTFYSVEESLANKDLPSLIVAKMFPIGYAANGDPLVLCFNEERCAIGLVSDDQFWEEAADPKEAYAEVTASIDEFLVAAGRINFFPSTRMRLRAAAAGERWMAVEFLHRYNHPGGVNEL